MLTIFALTVLGWIIFMGLITAPRLNRPPPDRDSLIVEAETRNHDPG